MLLALSDPSWHVREETARALGTLGDKQPRVISALLSTLTDASSSVREAAALAFRNLGSKEPYIIDALLQAFSDTDWTVRGEAAFALATLHNEPEAAGARIEELLRQYEPVAQRDRGYISIFNALQKAAEKTWSIK